MLGFQTKLNPEGDVFFNWLHTFSDVVPQNLKVISARDDIHAYLNSPDRCPKYKEKTATVSTSQPHFTPRRLLIPTAFLRQG